MSCSTSLGTVGNLRRLQEDCVAASVVAALSLACYLLWRAAHAFDSGMRVRGTSQAGTSTHR